MRILAVLRLARSMLKVPQCILDRVGNIRPILRTRWQVPKSFFRNTFSSYWSKVPAVPFSSRTLKIVAVILIAVIVVAVSYAALTFPRTVVDFPVAFSVGPDQTKKEFEVPVLNDKVQVEVTLSENSTGWRASIEDVNGVELWYSPPAEKNQTLYHSAWTMIPSGQYNFTFSCIGSGSLSAEIRITSKGGFW